jgi:multiple sugar transport system ATP-binding protein
MASIELNRVSKTYPGGVRAVKEATLAFRDGEFIVLVGPSGCGKSTLLRMIAGLEGISGGTVSIGGRVVNDLPPKDRDVAMVFQNYALYPHMTVRRNMSFGLLRRRRHGGPVAWLTRSQARRDELAQIDRTVEETAGTLGITALLDRLPRALSGGQRQRVALGRALVRDPAVFLFDEPLSNLDARLRIEMRAEIREMHRRTKATMVYVTHDQEEAMTLADRMVVMRDGVVQQAGTPAECYGRPANRFVAGFVGMPVMNFVDVTAAAGGLVAPSLGTGTVLALPPGRWPTIPAGPVTLGVRPDRVRVCAQPAPGALQAEVRAIEALGDRMDVVLAVGSARMVARVENDARLREGERAWAGIDLADAHLFEAGGDGDACRRIADRDD